MVESFREEPDICDGISKLAYMGGGWWVVHCTTPSVYHTTLYIQVT